MFRRLLIVIALAIPFQASADIAENRLREYDGRGAIVHGVPVDNHQVRMVAERVVFVPFFDAKRNEPRLLTHVWYDLVNEGKTRKMRIGFPELKALVDESLAAQKRPWTMYEKRTRSWSRSTIAAFGARHGQHHFKVHSHPGVGRYRRWFGFEFNLGAGKTARLHTTYVSSLAQTRWGQWRDDDEKQGHTTRYFIHYVLHTGARWRGPIGAGEIQIYGDGQRHLVRRFTNLEPTDKDDVNLELDFNVVEWRGGYGAGRAGRRPNLQLRLPSASGYLASSRVDTHFALAVDGDPTSQWVSNKGTASRAWLQLPSGSSRKLTGVTITSGQPPRGAVRPSRVALYCVSKGRRALLTRVNLPNTAGPHQVTLTQPTRCAAIRVQVVGVHGDKRASVAIAEVKQQFATAARWKPKMATPPRAWFASAKASARNRTKTNTKEPPKDRLAFDRADVSQVMWSRSGSLLHYQLHLENERPPFAGIRLGYIVDARSRKVVTTYRIDRFGKLPAPYEQDWSRAQHFDQGQAVLRKHGFRPAKKSRLRPGSANGRALTLQGRVPNNAGRYNIEATDSGFRWTFAASSKSGTVDTTLELAYERDAHRLLSHKQQLDLTFAARHATTWQARRPYFVQLTKAFRHEWSHDSQHEIDNLPNLIWKQMPQLWHRLTYRYSQAYGGQVHLFWNPDGTSVVAVWIDRTDRSASRPVETPPPAQPGNNDYVSYHGMHVSDCARDLLVMVCPWDRRDRPQHRIAVTVHSVVPAPTTQPAQPMPRAAELSGLKKANKGCGCAANADEGAGASLLVLVLLGASLATRRKRRKLTTIIAVGLAALFSLSAPTHAQTHNATTPPLRLNAFSNIPLPAGGRLYGPRAMRSTMTMLHYRDKRTIVAARLRGLLRNNKWMIAKERMGEANKRPHMNPTYLQLWVRKGRTKIRITLLKRYLRRANGKWSHDTVIFVTRDK